MKGVMRFGKKGKLSPRYIGPYRIGKRIGNVAYELELPQKLAPVHPVFHISMLKKCMSDPSLILPTENIRIKDNLSYEEIPVQILDRQVRRLRTKEVASVKVLWRNQFVGEATWEAEEDMKKRYPHLFESGGNEDQVLRKARRLTTDPGVLSWINDVQDADPGYLYLHRHKMQANWHQYIECTSMRAGKLNHDLSLKRVQKNTYLGSVQLMNK
ncbi:hypothetical protein MTR67_033644 [Solanum verrucosum]|uniref:Chromo domain-containing protein n=1 Tax=Solanum verrucosum TaxID=315347 RepID=A0AAF0U6X6_SOLVR|nr:hypothetical protein MTR67_033644 [Solanum verrucosum]